MAVTYKTTVAATTEGRTTVTWSETNSDFSAGGGGSEVAGTFSGSWAVSWQYTDITVTESYTTTETYEKQATEATSYTQEVVAVTGTGSDTVTVTASAVVTTSNAQTLRTIMVSTFSASWVNTFPLFGTSAGMVGGTVVTGTEEGTTTITEHFGGTETTVVAGSSTGSTALSSAGVTSTSTGTSTAAYVTTTAETSTRTVTTGSTSSSLAGTSAVTYNTTNTRTTETTFTGLTAVTTTRTFLATYGTSISVSAPFLMATVVIAGRNERLWIPKSTLTTSGIFAMSEAMDSSYDTAATVSPIIATVEEDVYPVVADTDIETTFRQYTAPSTSFDIATLCTTAHTNWSIGFFRLPASTISGTSPGQTIDESTASRDPDCPTESTERYAPATITTGLTVHVPTTGTTATFWNTGNTNGLGGFAVGTRLTSSSLLSSAVQETTSRGVATSNDSAAVGITVGRVKYSAAYFTLSAGDVVALHPGAVVGVRPHTAMASTAPIYRNAMIKLSPPVLFADWKTGQPDGVRIPFPVSFTTSGVNSEGDWVGLSFTRSTVNATTSYTGTITAGTLTLTIVTTQASSSYSVSGAEQVSDSTALFTRVMLQSSISRYPTTSPMLRGIDTSRSPRYPVACGTASTGYAFLTAGIFRVARLFDSIHTTESTIETADTFSAISDGSVRVIERVLAASVVTASSLDTPQPALYSTGERNPQL